MRDKTKHSLIFLCFFVFAACENEKALLERNKEVVRKQHAEVWSKGNFEVLEEVYTSDFICHFIVGPEWRGYEGVREAVSRHRTSFPDWTERIEDIIAEGDRVVTRFRSHGTHKGEFNGITPTGRRVEIFEVAIYRIEDDRIAEQWGFPDVMGLMQQLTETN
ncbi:MAG: ester cyclase [bacterium]